MTNTRIGDTEILESRFPCILRDFSIRRGSGGIGKYNGGCGISRVYEARVPMQVFHSGERRVMEPLGLHGGGPGDRGSTFWKRKGADGKYRLIRTRPCLHLK